MIKPISRHPTLLRWLALIIWLALIFFFSNQPSLPAFPKSWLDLVVKKSAHATAYGILFLLWLNALRADQPPAYRTILLALALTFVYAISDEWHQTFVAGRHGQALDVAIDMSGALIAASWVTARTIRAKNGFNEECDQ